MVNILNKQNPIKIIYLLKSLNIGGVERSTIRYANELVKKGYFVGLIAPHGLFNHNNIINKKIKIYYLKNKRKVFYLNLYPIYKVLKKVHQKERIQIVHYQQRVFVPVIFLIKFFLKNIKIVYTHQNIFKDLFNNLIIADKIIALNIQTFNDLPKRLRRKTTIIPHSIKIKDEYPQKNSKHKNIGYVGRFVKWKGINNLLKAFVIVQHQLPNTRLLLIGDGPFKKDILKMINDYKLTNKVSIVEPMINQNTIYSMIDVLVLPSTKTEGFGIAIIEAMARKIPVISSDIPIFREVIDHELNGIIFRPNDAKDLSIKLISLLKDKSLYQTISENGFRTVYNKFNLINLITEYENIYLNIFEYIR